MHRTLRLLLVLACLGMCLSETPLGSLVTGFACAESCPDDIGEGQCPPTCASCVCAPQGRSVVLAAVIADPAPTTFVAVAPVREPFPPEPPPADIFHVPKPSAA